MFNMCLWSRNCCCKCTDSTLIMCLSYCEVQQLSIWKKQDRMSIWHNLCFWKDLNQHRKWTHLPAHYLATRQSLVISFFNAKAVPSKIANNEANGWSIFAKLKELQLNHITILPANIPTASTCYNTLGKINKLSPPATLECMCTLFFPLFVFSEFKVAARIHGSTKYGL